MCNIDPNCISGDDDVAVLVDDDVAVLVGRQLVRLVQLVWGQMDGWQLLLLPLASNSPKF